MPGQHGLDPLATLVAERVRSRQPSGHGVLTMGSPVIAYGRFREANVATIGINPSHLEFVDSGGKELAGTKRRFHTLNSLGISSFSEAEDYDVLRILNLCQRYFEGNPNVPYFRALDTLLAKLEASYYSAGRRKHMACHLNLVQSSTKVRWAELSHGQRTKLLNHDAPFLLRLIQLIPARLLILNGAAVVRTFAEQAGLPVHGVPKADWTITDNSGKVVRGMAYRWCTSCLDDMDLGRTILILGHNHSLQNTWGLGAPVRESIAKWAAHEGADWLSSDRT